MRNFYKSAIAVIAFVCLFGFSACGNNPSFIEAFQIVNFENVTITVETLVSEAEPTSQTYKFDGDRIYFAKIYSEGWSEETYYEFNGQANGRQYDKIVSSDSTTYKKSSHYSEIDINEIFSVFGMDLNSFKKEDYKKRAGYYVLTDAAKEKDEYIRLLAGARALSGETPEFKIKIESKKLAEFVLENAIILIFKDYGNTEVTAPSWISLCG